MKKSKLLLCILSGAMTLIFCSLPVAAQEGGNSVMSDEDMRDPLPEVRLTLGERLTLQNAVCSLWHNSLLQDPAQLENVDPAALSAPEDIFLDPPSAFHYDNGVWVFEGIVRQMTVRPDGIEVIGYAAGFHMRASRQEDGSFRIDFITFEPVGRG